uniref:MCAfunc domain-containing protein n=1 Tax=Oryza barthii TaxID=65489 RepID=A0A0D3HPS4_9ORYZ
METLSLISGVTTIVKLANDIDGAVKAASRSKKSCEKLAERVADIGDLLKGVDTSSPSTAAVATRRLVGRLERALRRALLLVTSCQSTSRIYSLVAGGWQAEQFDKVNAEIDRCLLDLSLSSLALVSTIDHKLNAAAAAAAGEVVTTIGVPAATAAYMHYQLSPPPPPPCYGCHLHYCHCTHGHCHCAGGRHYSPSYYSDDNADLRLRHMFSDENPNACSIINVTSIVSIAADIAGAAKTARQNKKRCQRLAERVGPRRRRRRLILILILVAAGWQYAEQFDEVNAEIDRCLRDLTVAIVSRIDRKLNAAGDTNTDIVVDVDIVPADANIVGTHDDGADQADDKDINGDLIINHGEQDGKSNSGDDVVGVHHQLSPPPPPPPPYYGYYLYYWQCTDGLAGGYHQQRGGHYCHCAAGDGHGHYYSPSSCPWHSDRVDSIRQMFSDDNPNSCSIA